jgi:hypothetical protein
VVRTALRGKSFAKPAAASAGRGARNPPAQNNSEKNPMTPKIQFLDFSFF